MMKNFTDALNGDDKKYAMKLIGCTYLNKNDIIK